MMGAAMRELAGIRYVLIDVGLAINVDATDIDSTVNV